MKERGITDGLTMNQLAERNAEHVTTIAALESRCASLSAKLSMINDLMEAAEQANTLAQEAAEKLVQERNALAAENARTTSFINAYLDMAIQGGALDDFDVQELVLKHGLLRKEEYCAERHRDMVYAADLKDGDDVYFRVENPATDAFLAEVRASARNEGINYAASRLAAAFNHGFLDKPVSEVLDVTRMILSAKEDLANDPLPADDGLSGEYAEKSIEEWGAQLRKGGAA
ncbi:DUF4752 domain-containing protein [Salmonella enterica]|nr:DUF4752 domain-containing protein [Salmonella enterica]EFT7358825.1 DUF4752 domain-containing protein [Salmonella enterica]